MRRILLAGLALPFLVAPALSQTANQAGGQNVTKPPAAAGTVTTPTPMAPFTGMTVTTPVTPHGTVAPQTGASTAMTPTTSTTGSVSTTAGAPGANSFTASQAKSRLEDKGYTAVSDLKKGEDGIWRGTAMRDSKSVPVSVDYKGDISGG